MISERISDDTPPQNEKFEYGYPHSNVLLTFSLFKKTVKMYFVVPIRPAAASCI